MPSINYRYLKNRKKPHSTSGQGMTGLKSFFWQTYSFVEDMLFNPNKGLVVMGLLLPLELLINIVIVFKVNYTEIDWVAYMQEVEGFINGTFNYYELKGDTGPLVYPAGFVYIYTFFYSITSKGTNIRLAQFIYVFIYMAFISIVFFIYSRTRKVAPVAYIFMCLLSHRIHSIFILRLFNDPIAMLFLYASIACILCKWWRLGCILFSLGVSVKMNVLLFAPGLFVLLVLAHGLYGAFAHVALCAIIQLILGAPFLLTHPIAYIHRSFELGRQFFYIWTVNWKCVPEEIFLNRYFQLGLLFLHLFFLFLFMNKCLKNVGGIKALFKHTNRVVTLGPEFTVLTLFLSNFIGICFSRSLHYQFYVWYYHTFAYLLWVTPYSNAIRFLLFGLLELCWNVYPSIMATSLTLHLCHLVVLYGLWKSLDMNLPSLRSSSTKTN